jgi:polyisoprenoid-binding protein YceI
MTSMLIALALPLVFPATAQAAPACTVTFDADKAVIGWIGYKTNDKTAVPGKFGKAKITGAKPGSSIPAVLKGLSATIELGSVVTDNPARDMTLAGSVFAHLGGPTATGKVKDAQGDDKAGKLTLLVKLNGVEKPVAMTYTATPAEGFSATGTLDFVKDFNGSAAMKALVEKCGPLHTGADGVAKTWSEVAVTIKAPYQSVCK